MRIPIIKILIPYIAIILVIENKLFQPHILVNLLILINVMIICIMTKYKNLFIYSSITLILSFNLYYKYNLSNNIFTYKLPKREVTTEIDISKKVMINKDLYYYGKIRSININQDSLINSKVYCSINNLNSNSLVNKKILVKGILNYEINEGYQELYIDRCIIIKSGRKFSIIDFIIEPLSTYISNIFEKSKKVNEELIEFQKAIFLGKTNMVNDDILNAFKYSGTMHLFAVSGLHVGFIYIIFKNILGLGFKCRLITESLVSFVLVLYLNIVDYPPSAVRAFIMISVWQISIEFFKKKNTLASLSMSALLVLFVDPKVLLTIGFQLSYTVVLSILILSKELNVGKKHIINFIKSSFMISYAAFCGSLLLIFDCFQIIVPGSIFINVLLVPFVFAQIILIFINLVVNFFISIDLINFFININYNIIVFSVNKFSYNGLTFFKFTDKIPLNNIVHLLYPLSFFLYFNLLEKALVAKYITYLLVPVSFLVLFVFFQI